MKIEFTKEDEQQPSMYLGEGKFSCVITKIENNPSKAGAPMLTIEFTAPNNKSTRDWFLLTPGQKFKLLALVKACGINPASFDTDQLLHKNVTVDRVKTGTREYNGKAVDNYENSYSSGGSASANSDEATPF